MSGFITGSGENFLLDLICRAVTAPQNFYLALMVNEPPSHFLSGSELDEPLVEEYARAEYQNSPGNWSERTGEMFNTTQISFAVAKTAWPTIRHWGLLDAPESGTLLWAGTFDNPVELEVGDQLTFPVGFITLRTTSYITRVSL